MGRHFTLLTSYSHKKFEKLWFPWMKIDSSMYMGSYILFVFTWTPGLEDVRELDAKGWKV